MCFHNHNYIDGFNKTKRLFPPVHNTLMVEKFLSTAEFVPGIVK